jgi:hypothetical protein
MVQVSENVKPSDWEMTAYGIRCGYIGDFVTLRVDGGWKANCAWYLKYKLAKSQREKKEFHQGIERRLDQCVGPDCPNITSYCDRLIEEESKKR